MVQTVLRRMNEERLSQNNMERCPHERRRKERLRNSWMQEVTTGIREKEINRIFVGKHV